MSDDEKMIVKAFTKLSKATQKDSEAEWDIEDLEEQSQVFGRRRQFAENAVKFLKDERVSRLLAIEVTLETKPSNK